jgi:hypothetical protein
MTDSFTIKSVRSDAELVFEGYIGDHFNVLLRGTEVSAGLRVWGYTDCESLVELLAHLAVQQRDWSFAADWASIEGDLSLDFKCDPLGHVLVGIRMQRIKGAEDWQLSSEIETELGQLPRIAAAASRFFRDVG